MNKPTTLKFAAALTLCVLGLTALTNAQGLGISFGKNSKHGHVGVSIGIPLGHSHVHSHACRQYVPGHYRTVSEQVWVPGCTRQIWIAPVYRTEYTHCGNPIQVLVTPGHYQTVQDPGHYEVVNKQVWVPANWVYTCGC